MSNSSRLNGSSPVRPPSGGVWSIRKKSKSGDRNAEKRNPKEKESDDKETQGTKPRQEETANHSEQWNPQSMNDDFMDYRSSKQKKKRKRKIDLVI
jgi:hypothetical protein